MVTACQLVTVYALIAMPYAALCSVPTAPTNGGVTSTGISIGDTATYTCDVGFELVGTATATCTAAVDGNGAVFSHPAPTCQGEFDLVLAQ